jgi:hypothetical protein
MPRPCSICRHGEREPIERSLLAGEALRTIAERFATTAAALYRHRAHHLQSSSPFRTGSTAPEQEAPHELATQPERREEEPTIVLSYIPASVRERCPPVEEPYVAIPVDGRPPGPCPVCHSYRWRWRDDGSIICAACRPLPW